MYKSLVKTTASALALLLTLLTLPVLTASAAPQPDYEKNVLYVSPSGSDENDGSFSAPLATVQAAKEKLKVLKDTSSGEYTVYFRGGTYYIPEMLEFSSDDMPAVHYCAYENEKVVFSGASPITGFTEETVNGVKAFTKQLDTSADGWYFTSLFNGETTLKTPRFPETGYFTVASLNTDDSLWTEKNTPWSLTTGQRSFNASPNDVNREFHNQSDVVVRILHYWKDEMMYVTGFDAATGRVSLSRPSSMNIRDIDRYYFENVFEALNEPGEWYIDRQNGKLFYIPLEGEDADTLTLYKSHTTALVSIDGVSGISFDGITFRDTAWETAVSESGGYMTENGMDSTQAAYDVKGAFRVKNADGIIIKHCDFINLGSTAVKMEQNVNNSAVDSCYFENIGATGIYIGGDNVAPGTDGSMSNITLRNNEIYKYGRIFFNAVGIQLTYCDTADISNNEIHDGYYTGISCGWQWGYNFHATKSISIKNNLIYDIGQGWLSDMGGIYMLGIQNGTVISGNVIHNVAADESEGGYGGWGIYLDEGSSDMIVEKNLVYCCGSQGLNIHYGEGNVFRNNISALNGEGQVSPGGRDEKHATAFYYNNIFLTDSGAPIYVHARYAEQKAGEHFYENGNLMWDLSKGAELYICNSDNLKDAISLETAVKDGIIHNPTVADPLFKDAKNFDFTLSENSPAFAMNFKAWDYSLAGTVKDSAVGTGKKGGQTNVALSSSPAAAKAAAIKFPFEKTLLIVLAVLVLTMLIFAVIVCKRKLKQGKPLPIMLCIFTVLMIVIGYFLYGQFMVWNQIAYAVLSVLFILEAAVTAAVAHRLLHPAAKKAISVLIYFASAAVFAGVCFGLIYYLNSVLRIGSSESCLSLLCAAAVYELIIYSVLLRKTTVKHEKLN